jgi:hypothetical protein
MPADLVTLIETIAVTQVLTPGAKKLGEAALERAQRMGQTALRYLTHVGRSPQDVEPKVLAPLIQGAALETDEGMAAQWAALLANAADPAHRVQVQPAFANVLGQLTPTDAWVLQKLYFPAGPQPGRSPAGSIMLTQLYALGSEYNQIGVSVDNLLRLRLCVGQQGKPGLIPEDPARPVSIVSTAFGTQFMLACTPPTA